VGVFLFYYFVSISLSRSACVLRVSPVSVPCSVHSLFLLTLTHGPSLLFSSLLFSSLLFSSLLSSLSYVWKKAMCPANKVQWALSVAEEFSAALQQKHGTTTRLPVTSVKSRAEPIQFKALFHAWREPIVRRWGDPSANIPRLATAASIGNVASAAANSPRTSGAPAASSSQPPPACAVDSFSLPLSSRFRLRPVSSRALPRRCPWSACGCTPVCLRFCLVCLFLLLLLLHSVHHTFLYAPRFMSMCSSYNTIFFVCVYVSLLFACLSVCFFFFFFFSKPNHLAPHQSPRNRFGFAIPHRSPSFVR
jgi:hypothetical protein